MKYIIKNEFIKRANTVQKGNFVPKWQYDNKRNTFNKVDKVLQAEGNDAEYTSGSGVILDFLSNGFKVRGTGSGINADGGSYIYMAFAEHPFVSSKGVPVTAR